MAVRRLSKRENIILAACLILAGIYVGYNLVFKALRDDTATYENKIKVSQKRLRSHLKIISKKQQVEEEYERHSQYFKQKVSDEQEMASILSEIESAANEIGMNVSDMKPKKVRKIDFYNNFSVTLTIEGELAKILRFLYMLQTTPHLFKIDEIYFEQSSVKASQIICRLILSKALIPS